MPQGKDVKNSQRKDVRFSAGPTKLDFRAAINRKQTGNQQLPRLRSEVPLHLNGNLGKAVNTFIPRYFKHPKDQGTGASAPKTGKNRLNQGARQGGIMGNIRDDKSTQEAGKQIKTNKETSTYASTEGTHSPPPPPPPPPPENTISLADIMMKLNNLADLPSKINDIANDLKQIKVIQEQTAKLNQNMVEVQGQVQLLEQKVTKFQENKAETQQTLHLFAREISDLKAEITHLKQSKQQVSKSDAQADFELLKVKADMKKNNLIIEGLRETQDDRDHASYYQARSFVKNTLGVTYAEIDRAYRLGKPRNRNSRPRPLLIRFTRLGDRMDVWEARYKLYSRENHSLTIKEDLPIPLRPIQAALGRVAQEARKNP